VCETLEGLRDALVDYAASFDATRLTGEQASVALDLAATVENVGATLKGIAAARMAESQVWRSGGKRSPAHLLAGVSGTSVAGASESIVVARRLSDHPRLAEAARAGELSTHQAAAISGAVAADPRAEAGLLERARSSSLAELRDDCARVKAACEDPEARRRRIHARRSLRSFTDGDGAWNLRMRHNPEVGAEVMSALDPIRDRLFGQARAAGRREPPDAYAADALVEAVCGRGVAGAGPGVAEPDPGEPDAGDRHGGDLEGAPVKDRHADERHGGQIAGAQDTDDEPDAGRSHGGHAGGARPSDCNAGAGRGGRTDAAGGDCGRCHACEAGTAERHDGEPDAGEAGSSRSPARSGPPRRPTRSPAGTCSPATNAPATPPPEPDADPRTVPGTRPPAEHAASPPATPRLARRPRFIVRVDLPALLRGRPAESEVCEIAGYGPVAVSALRELLDTADPFLAAVVTKGTQVLGVAHLGRRPTAHQQTALEWLYPACPAEGCAASTWLENDYRVDWARGHRTVLELLDRLCTHHHDLKTREGWSLVAGRGKRAFVGPDDLRHPGHGSRPGRSTGAPDP